MKEINDEIELTLNLMKTDIDDSSYSELHSHLHNLLEIKREWLITGTGLKTELEPNRNIEAPELQFLHESYDSPTEKKKHKEWYCFYLLSVIAFVIVLTT